MTRSPNTRNATLLAAAFLLLAPAFAPLAGANGVAGEEFRADIKQGYQYVYSTAPVTRHGDWVRLSGPGQIEYEHRVDANGVGADYANFGAYTAGSGTCRFQVIRSLAVQMFDSGWRSCGQSGAFYYTSLPPASTYQVRITCQGDCLMDVYRVEARYSWIMLSVWASNVYSGGDVSEGRIQIPPGTCVTLQTQTTYTHSTLVEIDWGDGTPIDARPAPVGPNGRVEACHAYPPSAIPYQACFRLRETNGVMRVTSQYCRDLPFMLPRV